MFLYALCQFVIKKERKTKDRDISYVEHEMWCEEQVPRM